MTQTEHPVIPMSPATDARGSNLTELFSGIISDAQTLFHQQTQLIKAEILEDLRRTRQVAQCFGIGAILLAIGLVMLLVAGVHLLQYLTGWPTWAAWATVGGLAVIFGAVSLFIAARILASYNPLPDKSLHALQETVSCLTNPPK